MVCYGIAKSQSSEHAYFPLAALVYHGKVDINLKRGDEIWSLRQTGGDDTEARAARTAGV